MKQGSKKLTSPFEQRLSGYALAASAAGVGVLALGQPAEAERYFQQAIHLAPGLSTAQYGLAKIYKEQGKFAEALAAALTRFGVLTARKTVRPVEDLITRDGFMLCCELAWLVLFCVGLYVE